MSNLKLCFLSILLTFIFINLNAQKRVQNCIDFDGTDDVVYSNYDTSFDFSDHSFSMEAWIYAYGFGTEAYDGTVMAWHDEPSNKGAILSVGGTGQIYFGVHNDSSAEITSGINKVSKTTWTHIAATYEDSILRVYVNGVKIDTLKSDVAPGLALNIPFTVGEHYTYARGFWGKIDDVMLWKRKLTDSEISQRAAERYCGYDPSLRIYLPFNDGKAGQINTLNKKAKDLSGYGNDGTLKSFNLTGSYSNWLSSFALTQPTIDFVDTVVTCDRYPAPSRSTVYTQSGVYYDTVLTERGCDSAITIYLTIKKSTRDTLNVRTCGVYVSPSGNQTFSISGIYEDIITNSIGCDSIITINLKTGPDSTFFNVSNCLSYVMPISGRNITSSGIYVDTLLNSVGCDSLLIYDVSILSESYFDSTIIYCRNATIPTNGKLITEPGTYFDTLVNAVGCDSILRYHMISEETMSIFNDYACGSYTSASGKYIWTESGIWYDTLINAVGCDSVIKVNLDLTPNSESELFWTYCESKRSPSRKFFMDTTGVYFDTVMNMGGCDSFITIHYQRPQIITNIYNTVNPQNSVIDSVYVTSGYDYYQWYNCNGSILLKEGSEHWYNWNLADSNYMAIKCIMEFQSCIDSTECLIDFVDAISSVVGANTLKVYPNPSKGNFSVDLNNINILGQPTLKIWAADGRLVKEYSTISARKELTFYIKQPGIYIVELNTTTGKYLTKIIRY